MVRSTALTVLVAVAVTVGLAGCGGVNGGGGPGSNAGRKPSASATPTFPNALTIEQNKQEKAARAALVDALSPKTSASTKMNVIQDGSELKSFLTAHPNLGVPSLKITPTYVRIDGPTALYEFDVKAHGKDYGGQDGEGVHGVGTTWYLTIPTFCGVLHKVGQPLPSACSSAAYQVTPSPTPGDYPPVPSPTS